MDSKEIETVVKDRPYALSVLQTQILYDMAGMIENLLEKISKIESRMVKPEGKIYTVSVTVDRLTVINFVEDYPRTMLYSITLFNDGPDDVSVSVNSYENRLLLKAGESVDLNFGSPVIETLLLDVELGKKASVRGVGIY
jgi:hypothetical protein